MKIVGLTGLPRTGKDTLTNMLVARHGFARVAYATKLYEEVAAGFGVSIEDLASHEWKTQPQSALCLTACHDGPFLGAMAREELRSKQVLEFDKPRTSRQILQWWGTEYRRRENEHYWVQRLRETLETLYQAGVGSVVISDVRAYLTVDGRPVYNEFEMPDNFAFDHGGSFRLFEIVKPGVVSNGHSSDTRFAPHMVYATLHNDRTPEELLFVATHKGILL